jgi:hypothetical protein
MPSDLCQPIYRSVLTVVMFLYSLTDLFNSIAKPNRTAVHESIVRSDNSALAQLVKSRPTQPEKVDQGGTSEENCCFLRFPGHRLLSHVKSICSLGICVEKVFGSNSQNQRAGTCVIFKLARGTHCARDVGLWLAFAALSPILASINRCCYIESLARI